MASLPGALWEVPGWVPRVEFPASERGYVEPATSDTVFQQQDSLLQEPKGWL